MSIGQLNLKQEQQSNVLLVGKKCIVKNGNQEIRNFVVESAEQIIQNQSKGQLTLSKGLIQEGRTMEDTLMVDGFIGKQYSKSNQISAQSAESQSRVNSLPIMLMEIEHITRRII